MEAVAKKWIERTKDYLKEEVREQKIFNLFEVIFGIEPSSVEWTQDWGYKVLRAQKQIESFEDEKILGRKVVSVEFTIKEDPCIEEETTWEMTEYSKGIWTIYRWKKRLMKYIATVEIYTE